MTAVSRAEGERLIAQAREDAYAASYATSVAEGARVERARIGAIMNSPEAVGREQAAIALSCESGLTADEAVKVLAGLPKNEVVAAANLPDTQSLVFGSPDSQAAANDHARGRAISQGMRK